jgi:dihydroflavonol-4-reductase
MKALVTGGTGFVGGALVRRLRRSGWEVRVLARHTSRVDALRELGVEIAYGDILDPASVRTAAEGCPVVFHTAAIYELWVRDRKQLMRTETEGTGNVMQAALDAGAQRVVYTSSAIVIGERKGETGNEETPHRGYFLSAYEEAKFRAEEVARAFLDRGLPLVIVNPAAVYGPGDLKPSGRMIVDLLNGRLPALFPMTLSVVFVEDVAEGHLRACELGTIGRRYILAEGTYTERQWVAEICRLAQIRFPRMIPAWLARIVASAGEMVSAFTGKPPVLSIETWRYLSHGFRVDGSRAARELGIRYTPLTEGMRQTIQWYRAQGMA